MSAPRSIRDVVTGDGHDGLHRQVRDRDYRLRFRRVSPSTLVPGLVAELGPVGIDVRAIRAAFEAAEAPPTDAQARGTVADLALLLPGELGDSIAVWDGDRRAGKEWEAFRAAAGDKLIVRRRDLDEVMAALDQVRDLPLIRDALDGTDRHAAVFVEERGIHCKGQLDALRLPRREGEPVQIFDLKTTADASGPAVARVIRTLHYRERMALYRRWIARTLNVPADEIVCRLIFVSPRETPQVRDVRITSEALDWAEQRMLAVIDALRDALDRDEWPIYCRSDVAGLSDWEAAPEVSYAD